MAGKLGVSVEVSMKLYKTSKLAPFQVVLQFCTRKQSSQDVSFSKRLFSQATLTYCIDTAW